MKTFRAATAIGALAAGGLLALSLASPPVFAEDPQPAGPAPPAAEATKPKKGLFNRLRRTPKAEATAETVAPAATKAELEAATALEAEVANSATLEDLVPVAKRLKEGPVGRDPVASAYLDLVVDGTANAAHLNDFASYLARRGMLKDAVEFQRTAIRLEETNPTLWVNLGSMLTALDKRGSAAAAYKKAIEIDYANARAHYNLGAIYDAERHYDDAIEQYKIALSLDPSLGDPRTNPQVVNNERLLAVTLMLYQERAGSAGLPLIPMQKTEPERKDK